MQKRIYEPRREIEYRGGPTPKPRPFRRDNLTGLRFKTEAGESGRIGRYVSRGVYLVDFNQVAGGKVSRLVNIAAMEGWCFEPE